MNAAQLLFTSMVCGLSLRVWSFDDRHWLCSEDLYLVLAYRSESGLRKAYSTARARLECHSTKIKTESRNHTLRLFDEAAVRYLCEHRVHHNALHLLRWLDAGGMTSSGAIADTLYGMIGSPTEEASRPFLAPLAPNVVSLKALPSTPPACRIERRKAYCRELLKTLLRYTTEDEAEELVQVIEGEVRNLLSHRHCPGLNDARYDAYRRFWLQGGDV